MSKQYTTGEMAKLCAVTVRTVQYYDTRGILVPSALSEGGRRLYSEQDLSKMKVICFLREIGFSIQDISDLLAEENFERVLSTLFDQQEKALQKTIKDSQDKLQIVEGVKKSLKDFDGLSLESVGDIAHMMKHKEGLKKVRTVLLSTAIPFGILQWGSLILWIATGIWWPFLVYAVLAVPYVLWLFAYYYKHVSYICPECHTEFKPSKAEFFFAKHTFSTRKLTCTACQHKSYCVETYDSTL